MARGNIEKRVGPQGVAYRGRVDLDPVDGKRRRMSETFRTKREAERWVTERMAEIERGTAVDPSKMTVKELLKLWLTSVAAHKVQATTLEDYKSTIEKHIVPSIGSLGVQKLNPAQVQAFYAKKLEDKTGARTVELCHLRLSQALTQAVKWGMVSRNVCDFVDAPRSKSKAFETWSPEEANAFLNKAEGDGLAPLWLVALTTGARQGEILGLRWQDFDAKKGTLTVRQTVAVLDKKVILKEPKSRASKRTISLPKETVDALLVRRDRQAFERKAAGENWQDNDLIFASEIGTPIYPSNVTRSFFRLRKEAKVTEIRFHDMRHTHATWLLASGVPITTVSERLGHAKSSITLDVYGHVIAETRDRAALTVGSILFGDSAGKSA